MPSLWQQQLSLLLISRVGFVDDKTSSLRLRLTIKLCASFVCCAWSLPDSNWPLKFCSLWFAQALLAVTDPIYHLICSFTSIIAMQIPVNLTRWFLSIFLVVLVQTLRKQQKFLCLKGRQACYLNRIYRWVDAEAEKMSVLGIDNMNHI